MGKVTLKTHHIYNAEEISKLSSHEKVKGALGLSADHTTVEGTGSFINFVNEQETKGNVYSRAIFYDNEIVGVITLKNVSNHSSHIGTWIGYPFWGLGINEKAKKLILSYAFNELKLNRVFAGSKKGNIRSVKALEKLPYIRLNVENEFPKEHKIMQEEYGASCVLNVIEKNDFIKWLES